MRPGAPAGCRERASRGAFRLFFEGRFPLYYETYRGKSTEQESAVATYAIAERCIDVREDRACVQECPVDCIDEIRPLERSDPRDRVEPEYLRKYRGAARSALPTTN